MSPVLVAIQAFVLLLPTAFGFNWIYPVPPRQCSTFTIVVNGTDVIFPLKVVIVPVGPPPLPHEVRKVMEVAFPTNSMNLSFQLPYPTGSQFVGLVADASGYHGSATTLTILLSADASCFDATQDWDKAPDFNNNFLSFAVSPPDFVECQDVRIHWDADGVQAAQGTPFFLYVTPDGPFGPIPLGKIDAQTGLGMGFTWRNPFHASTHLIFVGGDNRGIGAGWLSTMVHPDPSRDTTDTCPASAANISSPASTSSATPSPPPNVGTIVGAVVGAAAAAAFLLFIFYLLRKKATAPVMQEYSPTARNSTRYGVPRLSGPPDRGPVPSTQSEDVSAQEPQRQLPVHIGQTVMAATTNSTAEGSHSPSQTAGYQSGSGMGPTLWDGRA